MGQFEKQQIGELFEIVPVANTVIAQGVAEVPELLNESAAGQSGCSFL
jgi:hypothetical protein